MYQRFKLQQIDRRLAEFDFRYNNRSGLGVEDTERVAKIAKERRVNCCIVGRPPRPRRQNGGLVMRRRLDIGPVDLGDRKGRP